MVVWCLVILSCSTITELITPAGLNNNFRSGKIKSGFIKKDRIIEVLDYRAFSDSLIQAVYQDSLLTYGLVIPRSYLVANSTERKMRFGTDSFQCIIHYYDFKLYKSQEQNSVLLDIVFPPDKKPPYYINDENKKTYIPYKNMVAGTMQLPGLPEEAGFQFEHSSYSRNFDSYEVMGYLKIGQDSLLLSPLYKVIPLHGKNVKPMQLIQGYSLTKEDSLFAFLQHAPTFASSSRKDVLHVNSNASAEEQMLMAAYFSLVSRLLK